mmetsp:Transcript_130250/g.405133  ORF Transcript_130250/g.405133 Transcript_130250/m.405133 type:complete len:254 (-) Transcript_130250:129-890(-)
MSARGSVPSHRCCGLFDVLAPGGAASGDPGQALLALLGPLVQLRLCRVARAAWQAVDSTAAQSALRATAARGPRPRSFSPGWGPYLSEEVTCPSAFARSLLHAPDPLTPEPPRLLGLSGPGPDDPGRYEVAEGVELLAPLLARGTVNSTDSGTGRCALHFAALAGSAPVAELLLEVRADVNMLDALDYTPVDLAISYGRLRVLQLLVRHGGRGSPSRQERNRADLQRLAAGLGARPLAMLIRGHAQFRESLTT